MNLEVYPTTRDSQTTLTLTILTISNSILTLFSSPQHTGPSGGNGGTGGSVYLECDQALNTLSMLRRRVHHKGKDGPNGRGDSRHGYRGNNCVIPVPRGTIVRDQNGVLAGELNQHGQRLLVARGGKGGRGNEAFKTPRMNAPSFCEKGEPGIERWLNIELKLIADVGLLGIPNAGKSTLLAAVSNAKPKIADYPFTTVVPNLGVCDIDIDKASGEASSLGLSSFFLLYFAGLPSYLLLLFHTYLLLLFHTYLRLLFHTYLRLLFHTYLLLLSKQYSPISLAYSRAHMRGSAWVSHSSGMCSDAEY